jgi:hypothetical protein
VGILSSSDSGRTVAREEEPSVGEGDRNQRILCVLMSSG